MQLDFDDYTIPWIDIACLGGKVSYGERKLQMTGLNAFCLCLMGLLLNALSCKFSCQAGYSSGPSRPTSKSTHR